VTAAENVAQQGNRAMRLVRPQPEDATTGDELAAGVRAGVDSALTDLAPAIAAGIAAGVRATWRDWMEPETPEPPLSELLTRAEFVERLQAEGVDVTARTLGYWEGLSIIPRAVRRWRDGRTQALYPEWMLRMVRVVRALQDAGEPLSEIRDRLRSVAWLAPIEDAAGPPIPGRDVAERFAAYSRAAENIRDDLMELARLWERVGGVPVIYVDIRFLDARGELHGHGFGAPDRSSASNLQH